MAGGASDARRRPPPPRGAPDEPGNLDSDLEQLSNAIGDLADNLRASRPAAAPRRRSRSAEETPPDIPTPRPRRPPAGRAPAAPAPRRSRPAEDELPGTDAPAPTRPPRPRRPPGDSASTAATAPRRGGAPAPGAAAAAAAKTQPPQPASEPATPAQSWPVTVAAPAEPLPAAGALPDPESASRLFVPGRPASPVVEIPEDVDAGSRPWTVAAAMEALPPLSPAQLASRSATAQPAPRSRLMTAAVLIAAAAALFVVIASHLDLGHTSAPAFAINELTAQKDAADTSVTPVGHFLTTAPRINLQASYVGATSGDRLTLRVSYAGTTFASQTYDLVPGTGTTGGPLTPQGPDFKSGVYTISAILNGSTLRTGQFTVDPSQPGGSTPPP